MDNYFNNIYVLQNTLLPYFNDQYPLKLLNKKFSILNYQKYNTHTQPHGILETYNPKTKILYIKENYKNGKLHGLYEAFYYNGNLLVRRNYKNGKENGLHEGWYDNGQLNLRCNYKNDKRDGLCEIWDSDGGLSHRYWYKDGIYEGLYQTWYPDGTKGVTCNFKDGKLDESFSVVYG